MTDSNTWIKLDLETLRSNIQSAKQVLTPPSELIFVVKANAYGHGMIPVAKLAYECEVKWFAVTHITEAMELRAALPEAQIIIVGAITTSSVADAIDNSLTPFIVSQSHATMLAEEAEKHGKTLRCHAKIDTGMGRLGFAWQEAASCLTLLAQRPGLDIAGMCAHFASSDGKEKSFADKQVERFNSVVTSCEAAGMNIGFKHISNSGAIQLEPKWDMNGVRSGILIYGYGNRNREPGRPIETNPILKWETTIVQVKKVPAGSPVSYGSTYVTDRETNIATVNAGYADGYSRLLSNKGFIIAGGKRCPVVGRVTMNFIMIDLGPTTSVKEGDRAVLIGSQDGESILADEIAEMCGTISYEILTSIRT